jgi:hypothetical protein
VPYTHSSSAKIASHSGLPTYGVPSTVFTFNRAPELILILRELKNFSLLIEFIHSFLGSFPKKAPET